jgi:hypothetical protein
MDVKRRRGPKPEPDREADKERERVKIEARTTEEWIDEGSVRDLGRGAAARASAEPSARREVGELDPEIAAQLSDALGAQRGARLAERLAQASEALDRERFDEAKRIAIAIAKEAPTIATDSVGTSLLPRHSKLRMICTRTRKLCQFSPTAIGPSNAGRRSNVSGCRSASRLRLTTSSPRVASWRQGPWLTGAISLRQSR